MTSGTESATGDAPARRTETLPALPGLGGLYARGAASSGRIAAGRALPALPGPLARPADDGPPVLPEVAYRVAGVTTGTPDIARQLADYQRLLHEPVADVLPAGYLHVLAFPLATAVMVRPDFPLPLLGMVHLANAAEVLRPVRLGDRLEVLAWAEGLRPHRRGVQVDLVAEVRVEPEGPAGPRELAYRGVSTYLAKGFTVPGEPEATEVRAGSPASTWVPPMPTGRWALGPGTGRAYGAISGDRNPIHLSALSAKAFGFPRAIAHGMYTAARALADVGTARGETYRWTVAFDKPVLLPSTVDVAVTADGGTSGTSGTGGTSDAAGDAARPDDGRAAFAYVGWNARAGVRHFTGGVTPLG